MGKHHAASTGMGIGLFGFIGLLAAFSGCSGSVSHLGGCEYNGQSYAVGDKFPDRDGCNSCSCGERGEVQCTLIGCGGEPPPHCTVGDKQYAVGEQVSGDRCGTCLCTGSGQVACTARDCSDGGAVCAGLKSELATTLASVQKCATDTDCGQPIPGSSCGCTRDLVARKDANLAPYLGLRSKVGELGCLGEGGSTCDCPNAEGFACVNDMCTWNYVTPIPQPVCEHYEASQLCVRGTVGVDGETIQAGDPLKVTVRSAGCLSSSCSKVIEASCTISSGIDFDVNANFCVADTSRPGEGCTGDCGTAHADCNFGQPLTAGVHQVRLGAITIGLQVPSQLPPGGLCSAIR